MDRAAKLRLAACAIVGLGAAFLMAALLLGTYTVGKVAKIPLNIDTTLVSDGRGEALNASKLAPKQPAPDVAPPAPKFVVDRDVPLQQQQQITTESGPDYANSADDVTLQVGTSMRRTDMQDDAGLMLAMIDTVTLNRTTGEAVDRDGPNGWLAKPRLVNEPKKADSGDPEPMQHEGLSYRFPLNVSKASTYQYFDPIAQKAFPANYEGEEDVLGLTTYHFRQSVGLDANGNLPAKLPKTDSGDQVAPLQYPTRFENKVDSLITARASEWDLADVPPEQEITAIRYYAAFRDFWVDPVTGIIVKQKDQAIHYFVRCNHPADQPPDPSCKDRNPLQNMKTLVKYSVESTQATVESQLNAARNQRDQIALVGRILPITLTALGLIALVGGVLLGLFTLRAQTALIDPGLDTGGREFFGARGPTGERVPGAEAETEKLRTQRRPPPERPPPGPPPQ